MLQRSKSRGIVAAILGACLSVAAILPAAAQSQYDPRFIRITQEDAARPARRPIDPEAQIIRLRRAFYWRVLKSAHEGWIAAEQQEPRNAIVLFLRGYAAMLRANRARLMEDALPTSAKRPFSKASAPKTERETLGEARKKFSLEAAVQFHKALKLNPTHPVIQRELGYFLCRDGGAEQGRPLLARALRLRPEDPQLRYYLAELCIAPGVGEPFSATATADMEKHLRYALRDPRFVAPRLIHLNVLLGRKDLAGARKTLAEIFSLYPPEYHDGPALQRRRRDVEKLAAELRNKPKATVPKPTTPKPSAIKPRHG